MTEPCPNKIEQFDVVKQLSRILILQSSSWHVSVSRRAAQVSVLSESSILFVFAFHSKLNMSQWRWNSSTNTTKTFHRWRLHCMFVHCSVESVVHFHAVIRSLTAV
ncbi:hypothetical protein MTO96_004433 [Rhipicephalus appendiculatus]